MRLTQLLNRPSLFFNNATANKNEPNRRRSFLPAKQAGIRVDHDNALTLSAVFRAVRAIAEPLALLQWGVYRDAANGKIAVNDDIKYLLHRRPNPEMSAFTFRETLIAWALTWGNGYAEIEFDLGLRPVALWPISPDRVEVRRENGLIVYDISNGKGKTDTLPASKIFHLHGLGFDGLTGYSVISLAARSIGLGMAAEEFGAAFFGNGAVMSGSLTHPGKLSDDAFNRLQTDFNNKYSSAKNAHKPIILEEGMKWESIGLPPGDAQFLETRKFNITDIARWYGVPPHKLYELDRATFGNIEHQSIEFVIDTIMPWAVRLEQEADAKVLRGNRGRYTKINLNALMRGDNQSRVAFYQGMRNMGVFSANDICALEDMNTIGPDGDKRIVQVNMTTLEHIGTDKAPKPVNQTDAGTSAQNQLNAMRVMAQASVERLCNREYWSLKGSDRLNAKNYRDYHQDSALKDLKPVASALAILFNIEPNEALQRTQQFIDEHLTESIERYLNNKYKAACNAPVRITAQTEAFMNTVLNN